MQLSDLNALPQNILSGALLIALLAMTRPAIGQDLNLAEDLGDRGFRVLGAAAGENSGLSVSGAGDVNGDGVADVVIGAHDGFEIGLGDDPIYLIFGRSDEHSTLDLSSLGNRGFKIVGAREGESRPLDVSGAGDVNGDGLADVVLGASYADPEGRENAGAAYIVFGRAGAQAEVDLRALGNRGFRIFGASAGDRAGGSVSGAGDVNGDGLADFVVGASHADPSFRFAAGTSYLVFGQAGEPHDLDLGNLGERGFRIVGGHALERSGSSVSGAGDVNGDGLADLIIGAPRASPVPPDDSVGRSGAGASFVVFGRERETSEVDLGALGNRGFRIIGEAADDRAGVKVSGAGDVNGDGLADVVVGAFLADPNDIDRAGTSYVVFGQRGEVPDLDLRMLDGRGFRILGSAAGDASGSAVSGAGDLNGDGLADVIVGSYFADVNGLGDAGATYVVFGSDGQPADVDLRSLDNRGFQILGAASGDYAGSSISSAGDVNGDGLADIAIGAPAADPNGLNFAGTTYVVFGSTELVPSTYRLTLVPTRDCAIWSAFGIVGDGTNDDSPGARLSLAVCSADAEPALASVTLRRAAAAASGGGPVENVGAGRPAAVSWDVDFGYGAIAPTGSAKVKVQYTDEEIEGLNESALQLYREDLSTGTSRFVPLQAIGGVDIQRNRLMAAVETLSLPTPLRLLLGDSPESPADMIFAHGFEE